VNQVRRWGSVFLPNPSLVLVPESALSLRPAEAYPPLRSLVVYP